MTLPEIKAALPKYIYLENGSKINRQIDEFIEPHNREGNESWCPAKLMDCDPACDIVGDDIICRRPIPDEVLENQAFWILWNKLATVRPYLNLDRWELHIGHYERNVVASFNEGFEYEAGQTGIFELHQRSGFESEEKALAAIPLLGGQWNIIAQMASGDLYSKWIGEQIT